MSIILLNDNKVNLIKESNVKWSCVKAGLIQMIISQTLEKSQA